jgi:hypothetical protein
MALHRDIYWLGRQWAVTGHGLQLIDQKLEGVFDIEIARLWDDTLAETVRAKEWLNGADFDKGLSLARARYPRPATVHDIAAPPPVPFPSGIPVTSGIVIPQLPPMPKFGAVEPQVTGPAAPRPQETIFRIGFAGSAKFAVPWRLRQKQ